MTKTKNTAKASPSLRPLPRPTIHALGAVKGKEKPLCEFVPTGPRKWPAHNYWVKAGLKELKARVTCAKCRQRNK